MYRAPTWRDVSDTQKEGTTTYRLAHWLRDIDGLCREEGTMYRAPTWRDVSDRRKDGATTAQGRIGCAISMGCAAKRARCIVPLPGGRFGQAEDGATTAQRRIGCAISMDCAAKRARCIVPLHWIGRASWVGDEYGQGASSQVDPYTRRGLYGSGRILPHDLRGVPAEHFWQDREWPGGIESAWRDRSGLLGAIPGAFSCSHHQRFRRYAEPPARNRGHWRRGTIHRALRSEGAHA